MGINEEFYIIEALDCDGKPRKMAEFVGKVLIIVNVASKCGLSKQTYNDLSHLLSLYYERGLRVLLFPCNEFLSQEPGEIESIKKMVYEIDDKFLLFDKINVLEKSLFKYVVSKSDGDQHELYRYLTKSIQNGWIGKQIKWNFTKFLIDRRGLTVKRYGPNESISENDLDLTKALDFKMQS